MNKSYYWLTPLLAPVIQLLLIVAIYYVEIKLFPVERPYVHGPSILDLIILYGLAEAVIGYMVSWIYTLKRNNKNILLLIYGILYIVFSISMGILLSAGDNKIIWIIIFLIPTILYLVPYIYGTIKFYSKSTSVQRNSLND